MDSLCLRTGLPGITKFPAGKPAMKTASLRVSLNHQVRSLAPGVKGVALDDAVLVDGNGGERREKQGQNGKWVMKILQVKSLWSEKVEEGEDDDDDEESEGLCECEYDETQTMGFDRNSFSKLLKRVSLGDARLYGQMSYLGNLAYSIPTIKVIQFTTVILVIFVYLILVYVMCFVEIWS